MKLLLDYEKKYWTQGKKLLVGIDEAGRGPLAGPVVAAAVIFDEKHIPIDGINDSKKLSEKKRESLYELIQKEALSIEIGVVNSVQIDKINILQATHKAMRMAIGRLRMDVDQLLVDGRPLPGSLYPQEAIIGGDSKCYSIAAASIIAKVYRDRMMKEYDKVFPGYGFAKHKGYGTKFHCDAIEKKKPCPIHRISFNKVREFKIDYKRTKNLRELGHFGEDRAAMLLYEKGYEIIERNYHCSTFGEIDIIAKIDDILCFIEVKTQRQEKYGHAENWVDERKMEQIAKIADAYLSEYPDIEDECRFDVIGVKIINNNIQIKHIEDAFEL